MQPIRSDSTWPHKISTIKPLVEESFELSQRTLFLESDHELWMCPMPQPNLEDSPTSSGLPSQEKDTYLWTKSWVLEKPGYLRGDSNSPVISILQQNWGHIFMSSLPTTPLPFIPVFDLISVLCPICPSWFLQRSNMKKSFIFFTFIFFSNSALDHGASASLMFVLRPVSPTGTEVPWGQGSFTTCSTLLTIGLSLNENLMNSIRPEGGGVEERLFHDHCVSCKLDQGQNGGCSVQTLLRNCRTIVDVHSNINQYPFLAFCYALLPGTGCCPDVVKH